jgi:hypothetical protein
MPRILSCTVTAILLCALASSAADPSKCTAKLATTEVPKELADPIRALLSDRTVQLLDDQGKLFCEVWYSKEMPVKATADEIKKGINYRKLEESTIFGAVRFAQPWKSFRKQDIKPGLYTLRLGFQPMDGDHQGSAPFNEFLLLTPAAVDKKAALMPHKELTEMSGKSIPGSSHPAVLLMYPNPKPENAPQLVNKGKGIWVLNWKSEAAAGSDKGTLGLGLVLFGVTEAE